MKRTHICPKCGGTDILRIEGKAGAYGTGNNIMTGMTIQYHLSELAHIIFLSWGRMTN